MRGALFQRRPDERAVDGVVVDIAEQFDHAEACEPPAAELAIEPECFGVERPFLQTRSVTTSSLVFTG